MNNYLKAWRHSSFIIQYSSFLLVGLLLSSLAGVEAQGPTVIKIWAMGAEGENLPFLIEQFEAEHPGVKVVHQTIPWGAAHEKLITAVVGGLTPDIAQMGTTWMPEFRAMNALQPLDEYLARSESVRLTDFFPGTLKTVRFGEETLGLPWYVETRCLYYRKDALAALGFAGPPATWEEFEKIGAALAARPRGYGISLPERDAGAFLNFFWQAGGSVLDEAGQPAIDGEPFRRAMNYYKSLFDRNIAPKGIRDLDANTAFTDEIATYPFIISGPWSISILESMAPAMSDRWSITPLPSDRRPASFLGGANLVVFRGSKNPELAWKFLEFAASRQTQIGWFQRTSALPSRTDAWEDPALSGNPRLAAFKLALPHAEPTPMVAEWEMMADEISREMEKVIHGSLGVDQAAAVIQSKLTAILAERRAAQPTWYKIASLAGAALLFLGVTGWIIRKMAKKEGKAEGGVDVTEHIGMGRWAFFFLFPAIFLLTVFLILPVLASFMMSFTDYDIYAIADLSKMNVVGIENYVTVLKDPIFHKAVWNTVVFAGIGGPLTIIVSLIAALMLERIVLGKAIFRTGFFLPVVTTLVAVAIVWKWIYQPQYGILNVVLGWFGIAGRNWLGDPDLALGALIAMAVWKNFGYNMIILLAGLQSIPHVYYEAAEIDGASAFERFRDITLPLLIPTMTLVTIMTSIGYLQFFAEPYIMTEGGPVDSTLSVILYLYRKGFKFYQMGLASATSYILFVLIFAVSIGQILWMRKREAAS